MKVPEKFKEYIWLLNIIYKYDGITFAKINEKWVKTEQCGGVELAKSTFCWHKNAIEYIFGVFIECDRD